MARAGTGRHRSVAMNRRGASAANHDNASLMHYDNFFRNAYAVNWCDVSCRVTLVHDCRAVCDGDLRGWIQWPGPQRNRCASDFKPAATRGIGFHFFGYGEQLSGILGHKVDCCSRLDPRLEPIVRREVVTIDEADRYSSADLGNRRTSRLSGCFDAFPLPSPCRPAPERLAAVAWLTSRVSRRTSIQIETSSCQPIHLP